MTVKASARKKNVVYKGGPFPGHKQYWPDGKRVSMKIRMGWNYGRYKLTTRKIGEFVVCEWFFV